MKRLLAPLIVGTLAALLALLPHDTRAATTVSLAWAGDVDGDRAAMTGYLEQLLAGPYLNEIHVKASYGGAIAAPQLSELSIPAIDAWANANLCPCSAWLIVVPTNQSRAVAHPYHTLSTLPYAVTKLPALPGYWQTSASHELVEMLDPDQLERADPCNGTPPWNAGGSLYARYQVNGRCEGGQPT
jgi:hypothetical protein